MNFDVPILYLNNDIDTKEENTIMTNITLEEYRYLVQENTVLVLKNRYLQEEIDKLKKENQNG